MTTERLKELLAKATEGPWEQDGLELLVPGRGVTARCPTPQNGGTTDCVANAELIHAAVNSLPALIARIEEVERLRSALEKIANHDGVSYRFGDEVRAIARDALTPNQRGDNG
jgi:hypothetical protein